MPFVFLKRCLGLAQNINMIQYQFSIVASYCQPNLERYNNGECYSIQASIRDVLSVPKTNDSKNS